jgi:propanediol utilization protein
MLMFFDVTIFRKVRVLGLLYKYMCVEISKTVAREVGENPSAMPLLVL